ncbi:methyl-accepting chemotaxis protein [Rhizobium sp. RU36D]|uniref:methyl-accepting chemotaxis protein n=1 Tax=Rhizobium sp. RU36D TaxID=1907415 RepID=UPI0009D8FB0E|nr:methyl-accepting chemotaxis protein [Rhizobium sp. RU36D]SMC41111.1 methyl-accepting chemotaxis protein [Rhizobium sp. RU36D]
MPNWFNSLSSKVVSFFLLLTALSIVLMNVVAYWSSSEVFEAQVQRSMETTLTFRGDMLREQLNQFENQAVSIAKIESLQQSMTGLKSGWKTIIKTSGDARKELRDVFVSNNPFPAAEREKLLKPEGPSGFYYSTHEKTQTDVAGFLADTQFRDLLIADVEGNIIYSYKKDATFAENITDASWAATGLGRAFADSVAIAAKATDDVVSASFSGLRVGSDPNAPDIYFAVPVVKLGSFKGVFLFQLRESAISSMLAKGITAASSQQSAFLSADGKGVGLTSTGALRDLDAAAFAVPSSVFSGGKMETLDFTRTDGPALAYVRPVEFDGKNFAVVESVLTSELQAGSVSIATVLLSSGVLVLVLMVVATWLLARRLFAPLARLATLTTDVANGKLDETVIGQDRRDEIGTLARSLERFRAALVEQRQLEAANEDARQQAEHERRQRLADRDAEARTLQAVVGMLDEGLQRLAAGELSYQISMRFTDELEPLRQNFNKALATLSDTLTAIGGNSVAVRNGAEQMRTDSDQLADRTQRQATAITQTASAIHAISGAVKTQTAKAEHAARMASETRTDAERSGDIMRDTIAAMEAIQNSSQKINQIIGVIDEIAFQTNLLALNAGVEAARAGESGKGFAVVAQEVRELAQRSSTAAKEISELLDRSTSEVAHGVSLVERAGKALDGIGNRVSDIDRQIGDIMASTREEGGRLQEISGAVSGLDAMTQQNAAMVEQTTAAIRMLAAEAVEMDRRLGKFLLAAPQASMANHQRLAS